MRGKWETLAMYETILSDIDSRGVATVTLNRAEVHNAFDDQVIADLTDAFRMLGADGTVRAILLKSTGKSFSAGADLNWMQKAAGYTEEENEADAMRLSNMLQALNSAPKPVIALIQGAAFGGGVGLVACADIAIAARRAKFALTEVKLGLTPATISPFVIAAIGQREARRLFLTASLFDAEEAGRIGLVHEVVEDDAALQIRAEHYLKLILSAAPGAVADAKRLVADFANQSTTDDLRRDSALRIAARRASAEGKEGLAAFFEKRDPSWKLDHDR